MARSPAGFGLVLGVLALATGCAGQREGLRYQQTSNKFATGATAAPGFTKAVVRSATTTSTVDCELRLYVEQRPSEGYYGMAKRELGVSMVERTGEHRFVDGVCVKKKDSPLELPAAVLVAAPDPARIDRFCKIGRSGEDVSYEQGFIGPTDQVCNASNPSCTVVSACKWNGVFHSSRPFTFTLVTAPERRVSDYVELVRIYRNGDLMTAWNRSSDQKQPSRIVLGGNSLRSGFWAATMPPHLAAMDFRIVPRGNEIGDQLDLTVRDDKDRFRRRVGTALEAGLEEALPKGSPARQSLDCLKKAVLHAHDQVMKTVRGESGVPKLDANCAMPLGLTYGTPLSDAYADRKNQTREKLVELKNDAEAELERARQALESKLPRKVSETLEQGAKQLFDAATQEVKKAIETKLAQQAGGTFESKLVAFFERERVTLGLNPTEVDRLNALYSGFQALAKDVDTQVAYALRSVDEARALSLELYAQASRVASDPERQAQIFNAVAESLQKQGDVFEARRDNPPALAGEQKLLMEYSDTWQTFALAPWNGVPIRTSGGKAEADLNAAVVVPLLDVFGVRLQWGKSRFAEARLAIGLGYTSTEQEQEDGSEVTKSACLPNVSLGVGTFKLGAGLATGPSVEDRFRLIVGADLMKLISGSNVEAL